jgi:hypothetical protein
MMSLFIFQAWFYLDELNAIVTLRMTSSFGGFCGNCVICLSTLTI